MHVRSLITSLAWMTVFFTAMLSASRQAAASDSPTYQELNLALYNLSDHSITVTWTDSNNVQQTASVNAQSMLFMTQGNIPTNSEGEQDDLFTVQIKDSTAESNPSFSISANDCTQDVFPAALSLFPSFCRNFSVDGSLTGGNTRLSYYITSSSKPGNLHVCLKGPTADELNENSINYDIGGVINTEYACEENDVPALFYTANSGSGGPPTGQSALESLALGTYSPTNGPSFNSQVLPGLSPTAVTPCIASDCVIPSGVNTWPVTIYYSVIPDPTTPGAYVPGFQYNSATNFGGLAPVIELNSLGPDNMGYKAINVPSFLTNYGQPGSPDSYIPIANTFPNMSQIPLPCWPLFNPTNGSYQCNGPAIFNTSSVASDAPKSNTSSKILKGLVYFTEDLVGLF